MTGDLHSSIVLTKDQDEARGAKRRLELKYQPGDLLEWAPEDQTS
jgi:hypothetical protein